MSNQEVFAIFPYLQTSKEVKIRGFWFRNSEKLNELPHEQKRYLEEISQLFYLRDNVQIGRMTYAHFQLPEDPLLIESTLKLLRQAQILVRYFYCTPQRWSTFLNFEHSNMYICRPMLIPKYRPERYSDNRLKNLSETTSDDDDNRALMNGYQVTLDWQHSFTVEARNRIYPSTPDFWLNTRQDLYRDLRLEREGAYNWAFMELLTNEKEEDESFEKRIFTALQWYNQSASLNLTPDLGLLTLAVAFESLLGLKQDENLSERFKETIATLLGAFPRLDSWVEQFYKARSKIVHEGSWPYLMFHATDKEHVRNIYKGEETDREFMPLISYGWRIFRLCFHTILSGAKLVYKDNLDISLFTNQERLERICRLINEATGTAQHKLKQISDEVINLGENYAFAQEKVKKSTLLGTAKLLTQLCLEAESELPESVVKHMLTISDGKNDEETRLMELGALYDSFEFWKGDYFDARRGAELKPNEVIWLFVKYALGLQLWKLG